MSEILYITELDELNDVIATEPRVVVKFTAPAWCGPCQKFAPHFETVADWYAESDVTFVSVDVDHADWATAEFGVRGVPTVILFEYGTRVRDLKERSALALQREIG